MKYFQKDDFKEQINTKIDYINVISTKILVEIQFNFNNFPIIKFRIELIVIEKNILKEKYKSLNSKLNTI